MDTLDASAAPGATGARGAGPAGPPLRPMLALIAASAALCAVTVPVHVSLYAVPVPLALLLGAALCGAAPLAPVRPRAAIALFGVAAITLPLLVPEGLATTWPWPWSVPSMIAAIALLGLGAVAAAGVIGIGRSGTAAPVRESPPGSASTPTARSRMPDRMSLRRTTLQERLAG